MKRVLLVTVGLLCGSGLAGPARAQSTTSGELAPAALVCAAVEPPVAVEPAAASATAAAGVPTAAPAPAPPVAPRKPAPKAPAAKPAPPKAETSKPSSPVLRNKISLDYEYEAYKSVLSPWHFALLEYARKYDFGTLVGRANYAHRFAQDATQYEVDAYPKLWKGAYAYFNYGYSPDTILPHQRFGAELFWTLPRHFEASLGLRRLEFQSVNVMIYTGSLGYYVGNFWFSVRPFVSHKPDRTSHSVLGTMRWYYGDKEDYLTVMVGDGANTDVGETQQDISRLNSRTVRVEIQKMIRPRLIVKGKVGYRDQEFPFSQTRESWIVGAGIAKLF